MPNFEVYEGAQRTTRVPSITIQRRGHFGINASAARVLGDPKAVTLHYDEENRLIGFKPSSGKHHNDFPLRRRGRQQGAVVSGIAFCKYYGISTGEGRRYRASEQDGMLVIDLGSKYEPVTGPGSKARKISRSSRDALD